jgi:hypothetical protein
MKRGLFHRLWHRIERWHLHAGAAIVLFIAALCDASGVGGVDVDRLRGPDGRPVVVQQAVINLWVQVAIMVVSALISYALRPRPPSPRPAALGEFNVPTAEEGRPVPVIFGTVWVTGPNVLWYGDLNSTPIKKGGK